MNISINKKMNEKLEKNEINLYIEYSEDINIDIDGFIRHIKNYDNQKILVKQNNEYFQIDYQDIILFYSDKKYIYCKTQNGEYKISNSLNKFEKEENDFVRISKSCIINIKYLDSFDMVETGIIIVKLKDGTKEIVSRRRVKEILKYIKERSI